MPDDFIESAVDEAIAETKGEPVPDEVAVPEEPEVEAATEEETDTPAAAEEETPEDPEAEEEEPLGLSAEQLAKINDNPDLLVAYKSLQAAATKKFQSASEIRKGSEEANTLLEYMKADPDRALREFAEVRGYKISREATPDAVASAQAEDSAKDTVDALFEKYAKDLGPESTKLLLPMMREVAEQAARNAVGPVSITAQGLQQEAEQNSLAAAIESFGANVIQRGGIWDDAIQIEMSKVMDRVQAGPDTPFNDYLSDIHTIVTSRTTAAQATKREIARLRKAKNNSEPVISTRPAPQQEVSIGGEMSEKDAIAAAVAWAETQV